MGSALAGKRARGGAVFVFSSGAARCCSRCVALLRERDARERKEGEPDKLGRHHPSSAPTDTTAAAAVACGARERRGGKE